jgi:hypothetical protein
MGAAVSVESSSAGRPGTLPGDLIWLGREGGRETVLVCVGGVTVRASRMAMGALAAAMAADGGGERTLSAAGGGPCVVWPGGARDRI